MRTRMIAIIVVGLLVLTGVASAQETTGTLTGKLVDTQGLPCPAPPSPSPVTQGSQDHS